ncbi:hypothetical protein LMK05_07105 [Lactococcus petauri]|nr:hypothetical protein LMK05_07105 [Lactococcus petauri]
MAIIFLWVIFTVIGLIVIVSYKTFLLFLKGLLWMLVIGIPEKLMPFIVLEAEKRSQMKREMKAAGTYPSLRSRYYDFINRLSKAIVETFTEPLKEIKESVFK